MEYNENTQKNREVFLRSGEGMQSTPIGIIELSRDFILPDSYADIKRILSVNASLSPSGGYAEGGKAYYAGELCCRVLFVSDEGEVRSVPFTMEYDGNTPLGSADGEYRVAFLPSVESVNARSVNPRKIGIKAKINPGMFAWERRDASVKFPDNLTRSDIESFEEKTEEIPYMSLCHCTANGIESGDDIRVDTPNAPIGEVLFSDITFSGITAEARQDAIAVNATADLTVAYMEEGGDHTALRFLHHPILLSTMIDCEGVKERDLCMASLYCEKLSCVPAENAQGEKRTLELDFSYGVHAIAESREMLSAVKDMYSTQYECENSEGEIRISRSVGKETLSLRCVGESSFKENGEVLGALASVRGVYLTAGENGKGEIDGNLIAYVLICEEDGSIVCETVEAPFHAETSLMFDEKPECVIRPMTEKAKASLKDGKLSVEVPVTLTLLAWENGKEKLLFSTAVTSEIAKREDSSFTVYFPAAKEALWDIAKKYRVPTDRLVLTGGEKGGEGRRALIMPPKKKPIFSGVIS